MITSNAASHGWGGVARSVLSAVALACVLAPSRAAAGPADDGYCDYVEGAAAATAATLYAPQVFTQFGYVEQPSFAVAPLGETTELRLLGGVRYSLTNVWAGRATTARARADCRRYRAGVALVDRTTARALAARVKIYDEAQPEAERILRALEADVEARQAIAQDLLATRLRVEELRTLAANARRALAALPAGDDRSAATLLTAYRAADADVERADGKLRTIRAYELNLRAGADRFLQGPDQETKFFGVVELGINFGAFWTGKGNRRAAAGRRQFVRADPNLLDGTTFEQLRSTLALEQKLVEQTAALVADLDRQLKAVAQITGEDGKRFRETLWFAWIKASADLAYQRAYIESLREMVGTDAR